MSRGYSSGSGGGGQQQASRVGGAGGGGSGSLFESYEQQVAGASAEITSSICRLPSLTESERQPAFDQIQRLLEELDDTLEQMELESRDVPPSHRNKYMTRLKSYKAEAKRLEEEFHAAKFPRRSLADDRMELLGGETGEDQRQKLLDNSSKIEMSTKRLEAGYRIAAETEEIGAGILGDLALQSETIEKSRERLRKMNQDLGRSSRVLGAMLMRVIQNRIVLVVFLLVLVAVFCSMGVFLYHKKAGGSGGGGKS